MRNSQLRDPRHLRIQSDPRYQFGHGNTNKHYDASPSAYKHVGRRTNAYTRISENRDFWDNEAPALKWIIISILLFGFARLAWALCLRFYRKRFPQNQEQQQTAVLQTEDGVNTTENGLNLFDSITSAPRIMEAQHHSNVSNDKDSERIQQPSERMQLIRSRFYYQIVLRDKSNVNADSLRCGDIGKYANLEKVGDDDSVIGESKTGNSSSSSSSFMSFRNLLSSWRKQPSQKDICPICKVRFQPGQAICIAKNTFCEHIFHDECIESWLMERGDNCPVCRCSVMIEVAASDVQTL